MRYPHLQVSHRQCQKHVYCFCSTRTTTILALHVWEHTWRNGQMGKVDELEAREIRFSRHWIKWGWVGNKMKIVECNRKNRADGLRHFSPCFVIHVDSLTLQGPSSYKPLHWATTKRYQLFWLRNGSVLEVSVQRCWVLMHKPRKVWFQKTFFRQN